MEDMTTRVVCSLAVSLVFFTWGILVYKKLKEIRLYHNPTITRFILISDGSDYEKEWQCEGAMSFLIGNSAYGHGSEVDIELGDTKYGEFVSGEHASLNYQSRYWYLEDLGSENGTGLRKKDSELAIRLKPFTPSKIDEGDIIYVAKAKILVR